MWTVNRANKTSSTSRTSRAASSTNWARTCSTSRTRVASRDSRVCLAIILIRVWTSRVSRD